MCKKIILKQKQKSTEMFYALYYSRKCQTADLNLYFIDGKSIQT